MNEYEILLSYLDKHNVKNDVIVKEDKNSTIKIKEEFQEKKLETPLSSTNKNKSVGFDVDKYENIMRSRLIDNFKKMQSYDRPYISVTESFSCLRKTYYSRMKYEIDLNKQFNFVYLDLINEIGNAIHSYIQEIYNFTEIEKTVISEKYKIKGRVDAIKDSFLYEFKTLDEKKFKGIYLKEHYYQPIIYSYILNSEYGYNIKTITLVYFFRDNLKRRPYAIDLPIDDRVAISFLENAKLLYDCIKKKIIPDTINSDKEQCRWCSYKKYCEKDSLKNNKNNISINLDLLENKSKNNVTFLL